jgi:hypothetical protein
LSEEVAGVWRRLHNEELLKFYASPYIIRVIKSRRMRWAGYVSRTVNMINAYSVPVGKTDGKRPFGRHRRRWEWVLEK